MVFYSYISVGIIKLIEYNGHIYIYMNTCLNKRKEYCDKKKNYYQVVSV